MRIIAYYLPQFHTIPENDHWWGKGFTEWQSVRNARPLFEGHCQPVKPGELGYYNLLDPNVREQQARLAREAGIEGFCYWHYWFGGKQLLERPLSEVFLSGRPDYPFCIGWANESWKAKTWIDQKTSPDRMLIEQTYPEGDDERHFQAVLPLFRDERYICVNEKPLLQVYRPLQLPNGRHFIDTWQRLAKEAGLSGLYIVGHAMYAKEVSAILAMGFDAVNVVPIGDTKRSLSLALRHLPNVLKHLLGSAPLCYDYAHAIHQFETAVMQEEQVIPTLFPNWDHTPRSHAHGFLLQGSTPALFQHHAAAIQRLVSQKQNQLVFLKSWNEWGEGNYMEPDARYGRAYIDALKSVCSCE